MHVFPFQPFVSSPVTCKEEVITTLLDLLLAEDNERTRVARSVSTQVKYAAMRF